VSRGDGTVRMQKSNRQKKTFYAYFGRRMLARAAARVPVP
jgi:hypothetical protein